MLDMLGLVKACMWWCVIHSDFFCRACYIEQLWVTSASL